MTNVSPRFTRQIGTELPVVLRKNRDFARMEFCVIWRRLTVQSCRQEFENRSSVGEIPETRERVEWSCATNLTITIQIAAPSLRQS